MLRGRCGGAVAGAMLQWQVDDKCSDLDRLEHVVSEELLQLFVGVVDAELFEAVDLEVLEPEHVEHPDVVQAVELTGLGSAITVRGSSADEKKTEKTRDRRGGHLRC